ncbi:unknown [Firmicutes bacterium CAG:822]|nr:unknown [Firmicutes bacterium CAG:822]
MEEYLLYELLKENLRIQDEPLKKLIWVLDKNFNSDYNMKQNILLIGERGSGKTTMLREVAELMEIPMGEIYNMFTTGGFNVNLFYNGVSQMMRDSSTGKGILLLHDFQNSFIYGTSDVFNAMIASGVLELGEDSYWDVSNITFIGEIDITNAEELFPKERDFLTDWQNGQFASPVLNVVQSQISNDNIIMVDEEGNKIPNVGFVRFVTNQIRNRFLSSYCAEAFQRKIFMNDMGSKEIYEALCSPHSALNLYRNDLDDDYMHSDAFIQKVVYQIMESGEGLHYVTTAVEDVLSHDVKQNKKVLKKGSLLGSHKK